MKESRVKIRLYLSHTESSERIMEFFKELNLGFELRELRAEGVLGDIVLGDIFDVLPRIELERDGSGIIRYYGYLDGLERRVFAEIVEILRNERKLEEDILGKAETIKKVSAEFTIFVAPFCIHCSKIAKKLLQFAVINPRVEVNVVDVTQFKDLQEKFEIVSVPVILVGQKIRITGEKSLEELIELAEKYDDPDYISGYIVKMIRSGRAGELSQALLNVEFDKILPQLLREGDPFLRLGVMYLLEELSGKGRNLESLRLGIVDLLRDEDSRVREDAIMALGKIGGKAELRILEELFEKESGQIKEALAEAIEEIKGRVDLGKVRS